MRKRKQFETRFWSAAFKSLPSGVRQRYLPQLKAAEGFEVALDRVIALFSHR